MGCREIFLKYIINVLLEQKSPVNKRSCPSIITIEILVILSYDYSIRLETLNLRFKTGRSRKYTHREKCKLLQKDYFNIKLIHERRQSHIK